MSKTKGYYKATNGLLYAAERDDESGDVTVYPPKNVAWKAKTIPARTAQWWFTATGAWSQAEIDALHAAEARR